MCRGPFRKVCHWGPIGAFVIVKIVSYTTIHCNKLWWPPSTSIGGLINTCFFIACSALTLYNFLCSIYDGPGELPLAWTPENPEHTKYLQFCTVCKGYKAPRSHHCKKCGRCIMKMDHHCPWINNCVGHKNHTSFALFLCSAVCGCTQSTIVLSCCLYKAIYRHWYMYYGDQTQTILLLDTYTFLMCIFSLGLSIGVVLAVGMLLVFQIKAITRNRTGIEEWIVEKAGHRRVLALAHGEEIKPFVFPYNLGFWENISQVINFSCTPKGDGITWKIADKEGIDEFTLTQEQIEQKLEKRQRAKAYSATREYNGKWLPLSFGWGVLCSPPLTDEHRLPLATGDYLLVTRWRKHWLFGQKSADGVVDENFFGKRGWFPRCCVIEITGDTSEIKEKRE